MAVAGGQAVAGVVFEGGEHARLAVGQDELAGIQHHARRIIREAAFELADDRRDGAVLRVKRIAAQIHHRAKVEVEARARHHLRHGAVGGAGLVGGLRGGHFFVRGGVGKAIGGAQALHQPALLVQRDQERQLQRVGLLQGPREGTHLGGVGDVVAVQDHTAELACAHLRQRLLHAGRVGAGAVHAHHHHLAHFLLQRQLLRWRGIAAAASGQQCQHGTGASGLYPVARTGVQRGAGWGGVHADLLATTDRGGAC